MKRKFIIPVLALGLAGFACEQDASQVDLDEPRLKGRAVPQDYTAQAPDSITVFQNVDQHPTIVRLCIDGTAWRTISSAHNGGLDGQVHRVEEWDNYCRNIPPA